ncbi:MAG TPA: isoprenyl transferase [bacterium]|nr:isoprenyl transferase [bacterium]
MAAESFLKKYRLKPQVPRHMAIIMDGNGRWAKKRGLPRIAGHRAGAESVREVVRLSGEIGVEVLTLYAFSTENWKRPRQEVRLLMLLLKRYLRQEVKELIKNNVRLLTIGRTRDLPAEIQRELQRAMKATARSTGLKLVLALSYSGRSDLTEAARKLAREVEKGKLKPGEIREGTLTRALSTGAFPAVDFLIRTSGEMRLSNFLLWELAYSEFYITPTLWPDFRQRAFLSALRAFQKRERRFGGVENRSGSVSWDL